MKKIMLIAGVVMILAAQTTFADKKDSFYIKAISGYSKLNKVHGFKSENACFLGIGIGFYVLDNVRTDLVFDHFINTTHKGSRIRYGVKRNHKTKGKIESLTYNGYVDLFDISVAKVFIGAGAGIAQLEAKNTFVNTVTNNTRSSKYKRNTSFTYALHAGASLEAAPGVNAELSYSYRAFGKTKKNAFERSVSYKGHHVGLGLRFDI